MIYVVIPGVLVEDVPTSDGRIVAAGAVPVPAGPIPLVAREVGDGLTAVGMLDRFEWRGGLLRAWGTLADRLGKRLPAEVGAELVSGGPFERVDGGLVCRSGALRHVVVHLNHLDAGPHNVWPEAVLRRVGAGDE